MHTNQLQKTISRVFPNETAARAAEIIFLIGVGMIAVFLHSRLRLPMHLPGKQGLLFMVLVLGAKGLSGRSYAASISCIGAASMLLLPGLGFHDPFMAVNYLLVGGAIDLVFSAVSKQTSKLWIIAGAAGLCWVLIPAFRLLMLNFVSMPLGAFRSGIAYPFITHLLFGLAGGLMAAGLLGLVNLKKDHEPAT